MKSSQSNFDLRSPSSYLARSYLIATVQAVIEDHLMEQVLHPNRPKSFFDSDGPVSQSRKTYR